MADIDLSVDGTQIDIIITTGIDALGRELDTERALQFMTDMSTLNTIPEDVRSRIKLSPFMGYIGAGRDVPIDKFLLSEEEVQAKQAADADAQAQRDATSKGQGQQAPQLGQPMQQAA